MKEAEIIAEFEPKEKIFDIYSPSLYNALLSLLEEMVEAEDSNGQGGDLRPLQQRQA